jgi:hypothetical protein
MSANGASTPVPDRGGRELLDEWRGVMEAVVSSAASAAGRPELPGELVGAMQSQLSQMQRVVDRERLLGSELAGRILGPVDTAFDLLEESGATLRREAETLESAGQALQETARLIKRQAELFEQTIGALREPAELAKAAAGLQRRRRKPRDVVAREPSGGAVRRSGAAKGGSGASKARSGRAKPSSRAAKPGGSTAKPSSRTAKPRGGAAKPGAGAAKRPSRGAKP